MKAKTYIRTLKHWEYPTDRIRKIGLTRKREREQMLDYLYHDGCRMAFLVGALDDLDQSKCGRCDNCMKQRLMIRYSDDQIQEAERLIRSAYLVIPPWPQSGSGSPIPDEEQLMEGRCLSQWRDGGFGDLVAVSKKELGNFGDELVKGVLEMIRHWNPTPSPQWVASVPSSKSGGLVLEFAQRVARALGLPYLDVLERTRDSVGQKTMENSLFQAENVRGAFRCSKAPLPTPVLLIDDIVDSGWTFTEVGKVLRRSGSGKVFPVALTKAQPRREL